MAKPKRAKRHAYHHGDLTNALITAAAAVLDRHGLEALTLREAARRAGVSHAAPYRHFKDRAALLQAVAADGFLMLIEDLDAAAGGAEAMADAYRQFARDNPGRFALMFDGALARTSKGALAAAQEALADHFTAAFGAARGKALWAQMHGEAALAHAGLPRKI